MGAEEAELEDTRLFGNANCRAKRCLLMDDVHAYIHVYENRWPIHKPRLENRELSVSTVRTVAIQCSAACCCVAQNLNHA